MYIPYYEKYSIIKIKGSCVTCICCSLFYPWFNFSFLLFHIHYHNYQRKRTKESKNWTKDKIELQYVQHIFLYILWLFISGVINVANRTWLTTKGMDRFIPKRRKFSIVPETFFLPSFEQASPPDPPPTTIRS